VRTWRNNKVVARITETESYVGEDDQACHARFGRTVRTEIMYGPPGQAYIYLIYGRYYMLNVVTEADGFPAAVLIRAAKLITGEGVLDGPGKLTRTLHITRAQNKLDLITSNQLYLANDSYKVIAQEIKTSPRIGVDYAGKWAKLPWRYFI
jgi:DNA-3-methyladenine glycosylase